MSKVVTISKETPAEFIRRNGPTLTWEIANRFVMDHRDALKMLKAMERKGEIKSKREAYDIGAGLEWLTCR